MSNIASGGHGNLSIKIHDRYIFPTIDIFNHHAANYLYALYGRLQSRLIRFTSTKRSPILGLDARRAAIAS